MKNNVTLKRLCLSSAIETEDLSGIVEEIETKGEDYCLGYIVYKRFSDPLEHLLKRTIPSPVVFIEIFLVFLAVSAGVALITKQPIALPSVLMVVLAVASGGFWIIKVGYNLLLPTALKYAIELPVSDQGKRKMVQWIIESFDLKKHLFTTFVFLLILVGSFILVDIFDDTFPVSTSSYVAVILAGISIAQGLYWAIRIPGYGTTLLQFKLKLFPLDPSLSPSVLAFTKVVIKSTILAGVFFGLSLAILFWVLPYAYTTVNVVLIIWYVIGLLIISIFFFYSISLISKIISNGKLQTLEDLQNQIQSKLSGINSFSKEDFVIVDERNVSIGLGQLVSEFTEVAEPRHPLVWAD